MTPSSHAGAGTGATPDLVVYSHLRWSWVWQRPQHLISRLAAAGERHVWFVEEPLADGSVDRPTMRWFEDGAVTVGRLHVPGCERHIGFDAPESMALGRLVAEAAAGSVPVTWIYTPLALDAARLLRSDVLVYDVMDDLASFKGASPHLRQRQAEALDEADVVFTGGRSLHRSVASRRPTDTFLFPSGVETEHYAPAVEMRRRTDTPVAGYVGVVDERLDLDLLDGLAAAMPDWEIRIVGPVAKIDPACLPQRPNITYAGAVSYPQLPAVMAGFDVALMPFAMNEATRSISPTKTLEYLAAGLPVVSSRVPDVVADYGHVVALADDVPGFAAACRGSLDHEVRHHRARCGPILEWHHWDRIAERMAAIIAMAQRAAASASASAGLERTA